MTDLPAEIADDAGDLDLDLSDHFFEGFMAAVAVEPREVAVEEWSNLIFTPEIRAELDANKELDSAELNLAMVSMRYAMAIDGDDFEPSFLRDAADRNKAAMAWAAGFVNWAGRRQDKFLTVARNELYWELCTPMIELAADSELLDLKEENIEPLTEDQVDECIDGLLEALPELVALRSEEIAEAHTPFVRAGPKAGRNDPCPCGSGKKYKKCCGA